VRSYIGTTDLFGRRLEVSQANVAVGLAAAVVVTMGEGSEQTPICVIDDAPFIEFQPRDPSKEEIRELFIEPDDDLFAPFLNAVRWKQGDEGTPRRD
jgi:dihydrofolate synthase / folylpolyglutamate synthase